MTEVATKIFKSLCFSLMRFVVATHFLIIITFVFLRYLPGSYLEDEFIVVEKNRISENFFFELKKYLVNVYHFDFGFSYQNPQTTVKEIIFERYQYSVKILAVAFLTIVLAAVLLSFAALLNKKIKKIIKYGINFMNTIPLIVLLPLLIYSVCFVLHLIPARYSADSLRSFIFAVFLIAIKPVFQLTELLIQKWTVESLSQYNITAKAKGLSKPYILLNHSFRNIFPSYINFSQSVFLSLISGNFLVESFYSIPGVGLSFVEAMTNRDLPLILGCIVFLGILFFTISSLSEAMILLLQPERRAQE